MKNRIQAALLAVCLVLLSVLPAQAVSQDQAVQVVQALGILSGDERGNLNLSSPVTRAEFVTMAVKALPGGGNIVQAATSPYPDVPRSHWASGYVEAGVRAGLVSGFSDGTFRPNRRITLAEGATVALQLLGYGPGDVAGAYPAGQLVLYRRLGLDEGVSAADPGTELTRRDAAFLFYNLLSAKTKDGQVYLTTLGYSLNQAGEPDLVALLSARLEGPVVVGEGWAQSLPFPLSSATVYRDGTPASSGALQPWDVVYYNSSALWVWAYSNKVTGTIQALEPSAANPASVTVAGRTFALETASAAYDLSSLGSFGLGDSVTLLLGRTGGVAAVADTSASGDSPRVGVVTAVETASYPDGHGGTYTAPTATLLATDGQSYRYPCSGLKEGDLARVLVSGTGEVSLARLSSASLSGQVDGQGTRVGDIPLSPQAEILDVSGEYGLRVYPGRLAGVSLTSSMVSYYSRNSAGEIDRLILKDVTGDMHHYGILTQIQEAVTGGMSDYYAYQLDMEGTLVALPQSTTRYPVQVGPVCLKGSLEQPDRLISLTSAGTGKVVNGHFEAGSRRYSLAEQTAIYLYKNGSYQHTTLAKVLEEGLTLTGWYDKAENAGGRLRVILAQ